MEDPYYEARDAVGEMVEGLRAQHERLQDLVRSKTSSAAQVKEVRRSLVMDIRAVDKEFKVLKGSVANVEQNRGKYPAIKEGELEARKAFINETLKTLKAVKTGVESEAVKRKRNSIDNHARGVRRANRRLERGLKDISAEAVRKGAEIKELRRRLTVVEAALDVATEEVRGRAGGNLSRT
jgi:hypothetical protein